MFSIYRVLFKSRKEFLKRLVNTSDYYIFCFFRTHYRSFFVFLFRVIQDIIEERNTDRFYIQMHVQFIIVLSQSALD
jgi:hypothetical protein